MRSVCPLLAASLFSLFAAPALAEGPLALDLPIAEKKLANGLTVYVHEDHRAPTVSVVLWYDVGSKDDPPGRSGFAHLFEHLMLQGSRHVPEDAHFRYLEQAGATYRNATTGPDRTNYWATLPANELELVMWLESDRMAFLLDHLDDKTFKNQRDVVKNERRQSYEDKPYGFGWILLNEALYPAGHPYHRVTIGSPADLDVANVDEARAFWKTYDRPNNATVVIAGDVATPRVFELAEKWFGPVAARPLPARPAPPQVVLGGETLLDVATGAKLPKIYLGWPTPPAYGEDGEELDVLAATLTDGPASRLRRKLVRELEVAESVDAYNDGELYGGMFVIEAVARPGHTGEELVRLIDAELARIKTDIAAAEVARAKAGVLTQLVFLLESDHKRADKINELAFYTHDPRYLPKTMARYEAVSADAVKRVATRWLPADRRIVEIMRPVEGAPISGVLKGTTTTPAVGR